MGKAFLSFCCCDSKSQDHGHTHQCVMEQIKRFGTPLDLARFAATYKNPNAGRFDARQLEFEIPN